MMRPVFGFRPRLMLAMQVMAYLHMKPIGILITSLLIAAVAAPHAAADLKPAATPNIVVILIDDMPYAGMSLTRNTLLETPNMDRLAKKGIFFTRAYSQPICGPSRADIMTGQCAGRHGRTDNVPGVHPYALMQEPLLPLSPEAAAIRNIDLRQSARLPDAVQPDTYTVVRALKSAGYRTGLSGKWHLTEQHLTPAQARALGFDFCNESADRSRPYRDAERFTDDAIRFIRDSEDQRFFLYLPYVAVHGPHIVPPEDAARWQERLRGQKPGIHPDMLASLEFIDRSVGRVLRALDELGLADDTMVVLASDNGGVSKTMHSAANKPFRMGKGSHYEGGVRVPLLVRWPGHAAAGTRCDVPVQFADLLPTFCDVAGVAVPPGLTLDGVSLAPLLAGGTLPRRSIFLHYPHYLREYAATPVRTVIQDRYKLVWNPYDHIEIAGDRLSDTAMKYVAEPRVELFDLQADPGEHYNIAEQEPEKVAEMCRLFEAWMKEVGAKDVSPNPSYDAARPMYNIHEEANKTKGTK
jgi:arylsulfatase A-like enzyme